ncbi:MAG: SRPBCC domain-containing protein [Flavobacteriaceae bacterium]|nr:SRPBCC domain-containing protein [Flavobacteriaceae bacterium]
MAKLDWHSFTKKIHIHAAMDKIYRCWSTTEGISAWFLKDAIYIREGKQIPSDQPVQEGDTYTWMWHNWDGQEAGKILKANGKDMIRFTFANTCTVTITLEQKDTAVLLSLAQTDIPEDDQSKLEIFYGCSNGWTFWLANLKAYLEHGILLNEKDIDLKGFDLAGYEFVNM